MPSIEIRVLIYPPHSVCAQCGKTSNFSSNQLLKFVSKKLLLRNCCEKKVAVKFLDFQGCANRKMFFFICMYVPYVEFFRQILLEERYL